MATENGALGHITTADKCLDFFTMATREIDPSVLKKLFDEAYAEHPLICLKIVYHLRDPRGGKGEKKLTNILLKHMCLKYSDIFVKNLKSLTVKYGCYKMLCQLYSTLHYHNGATYYPIDEPLKILVEGIREGNPLAGKWAPSEGSFFDKEKGGYQARRICEMLGFIEIKPDGSSRCDFKKYRELVSPLRKQANIVEQLMCSNSWDEIDFNKVSASAMHRYSKEAFDRHCPESFNKWKESVAKGKGDIKVSGLHPHEIISAVRARTSTDIQELQWAKMIAEFKGKNISAMAMCDVSGSMTQSSTNVKPIDVAIALSLFLAECSDNKLITFNASPTVIEITGSTLQERVKSVYTGGGLNTNFTAAMLELLNYGKIPEYLFVFSDMEFDAAQRNVTPYQYAKNAYNEVGVKLPKIIFWNIACRSGAFPISSKDEDVILVSGFSHTLLTAFLQLRPEELINPITMMLSILRPYNPVI